MSPMFSPSPSATTLPQLQIEHVDAHSAAHPYGGDGEEAAQADGQERASFRYGGESSPNWRSCRRRSFRHRSYHCSECSIDSRQA